MTDTGIRFSKVMGSVSIPDWLILSASMVFLTSGLSVVFLAEPTCYARGSVQEQPCFLAGVIEVSSSDSEESVRALSLCGRFSGAGMRLHIMGSCA